MAIVRPVTKTKIQTVEWGIPITDEVNRLTTLTAVGAWTNAVLQNGWVNLGAGWPTAQYRKVNDMVHIRGMVGNGTAAGAPIFTLPAGFRPPSALQIATVTGSGVIGVTTLNTDGTVQASVGNNGSWMLNFLFAVI
jgi:hypothetical protein